MRRALRVFALAALALAVVAASLGLLAWRQEQALLQAALDAPPTELPVGARGALEVVHAVAGHVATLVTCAVAGMAFLLGLHGLLESGGRRARAAVLFVLGPAVMGVALWAELTGLRRGRDEIAATIAGPDMEPLLRAHVIPGATLVAAALLAAAAAWLLARPERPGSDAEE